MAVFRVERNKGYTVMSNHHLRNKELTLKAKGLLSQMLSLVKAKFMKLDAEHIRFVLDCMKRNGRIPPLCRRSRRNCRKAEKAC